MLGRKRYVCKTFCPKHEGITVGRGGSEAMLIFTRNSEIPHREFIELYNMGEGRDVELLNASKAVRQSFYELACLEDGQRQTYAQAKSEAELSKNSDRYDDTNFYNNGSTKHATLVHWRLRNSLFSVVTE